MRIRGIIVGFCGLFVAGGSAPASQAATAQLALAGTVSPTCNLVGTTTALSLGDVSGGKTGTIGSVGLACNLVETGPTVTVSSANSGLKRNSGTDVIGYTMAWPVAGTNAFNSVNASSGSVSAQLSAVSPGTSRSGNFSITVSAAASTGKAAGTYRDIITISIAP